MPSSMLSQCSPPGLLPRCDYLGHATDDAHALAARLYRFCGGVGGVAELTTETRELFHQMAGQSLMRSVPSSSVLSSKISERSAILQERTLKRGPVSWLIARPTRISCGD